MSNMNTEHGAFVVRVTGCAGLRPGTSVQLRFDDSNIAAAVQNLVNDGLRWQGQGATDRERVIEAMRGSRSTPSQQLIEEGPVPTLSTLYEQGRKILLHSSNPEPTQGYRPGYIQWSGKP